MGFHSMSASWARFASMMPTPPVCLSSSPSCPEYRIFSPDVRVSCPESGHRVSQRPSTVMLFFFISVAICAALDVSSIVLTFQVAMLIVVLVSRSFGVVASRGLSPLRVIRGPVGPPSRRRRTEALGSLVFVSVAGSFFTGWGSWPHAQPSSFIRAWDRQGTSISHPQAELQNRAVCILFKTKSSGIKTWRFGDNVSSLSNVNYASSTTLYEDRKVGNYIRINKNIYSEPL